jgi:NAD(P) transhydrogenase subunit beta
VNPAALAVDNTPLSGMPILRAHDARAVVVCNLDARPGYSGVENPLYRARQTLLLLGNALESVQDVHTRLVTRAPGLASA